MFKKLIQWSLDNFSHLPWRRSNRSLYTTLVSEIMLQQTTVPTVLNHFDRFLKLYPDLKRLATASDEEIQIAWKGLGYYRRARNLLAAARYLLETHKGEFPLDEITLQKIPGIGKYTANALLSIGADQRALALDANLERVLGRFYLINGEKGPKLQKKFYQLFEENKLLSPMKSPRLLMEAFMDLGRTICKSDTPQCEKCPLQKDCQAYKMGSIPDYPYPTETKAKQKFYKLDLIRFFTIQNDKILVYQKSKKQWLSNQWEVPTFILESEDRNLDQYPYLPNDFKFSFASSYKTTITKYKITNHIVLLETKDIKRFKNLLSQCELKELDFDKTNLAENIKKGLSKIKYREKL